MVTGLLGINGFGFLGFGLFCLFVPGFPAELVGFGLSGADATIEIRAQYGGLFTIIGVFGLLGLQMPAYRASSVLLLMLVYCGLGTGRFVGLALDTADTGPTQYTYYAAAFELLMSLLLAYLVFTGRHQPAPATSNNSPDDVPLFGG